MKTQTLLFCLAANLALTGGLAVAQPNQADPPPDREVARVAEQRRERLQEILEQLRQKEAAGSLTPEEQRRLERLESSLRRVEDFRSRELPPRQMPREPQRDLPRVDRPPAGATQALPPGRFAPQLERVLTEDQRASLREIILDQRERTRELEQRLREARRELMHASLSPRLDEDAVRRAALETGRLEGELAVLRGRALARVRPRLAPEQIERIRNMPPIAAGEARPELRREQPREELRRAEPRRGERPLREPRDEHDLPPPARSPR